MAAKKRTSGALSLRQDPEFFQFWRTLHADKPSRLMRFLNSLFSSPNAFESEEDYLMYLRCLFAYGAAAKFLLRKSIVLDLGCGAGYGTQLLSKSVASIIGLDIDEVTVRYATQKYGSKKCDFRTYGGVAIPYGDGHFDSVVSFQVIEHVADDQRYVAEVARVLKEGGLFILTTPNREIRLKPGQKPWNRFHVREYSGPDLVRLLSRSFSEVEVFGIHGRHRVQQKELERLRQRWRIDALDPLHLRMVLPGWLKPLVIQGVKGLLFRRTAMPVRGDLTERYSLRDFFVSKKDVETSLDLFVVCRK